MDYRSLSAVLIKTAGMLLIVFAALNFGEAVLGLAFTTAAIRPLGLLAMVSPLVTAVLGIVLLRYPYSLVNRWIVPPSPDAAPLDSAAIEQVIYAGIGLAVIAYGLQSAGQWLAVLLTNPGYLQSPENAGWAWPAVVQLLLDLALGAALMLGARGLTRLRRRLRA